MPDAETLCYTPAQVDDMPAELQSARVKCADFMLLAKLRWSSQQLVAAMRLFHQATGQFGRENLQVLAGGVLMRGVAVISAGNATVAARAYRTSSLCSIPVRSGLCLDRCSRSAERQKGASR